MTQSTIKPPRGAAPAAGQGASEWRVVSEVSRVGFRVQQMGMYFVRGRLRRVDGVVELGADGTPVSGWLKLDAASISTGMPPRDLHLRSRDFLEVVRHPEILVGPIT